MNVKVQFDNKEFVILKNVGSIVHDDEKDKVVLYTEQDGKGNTLAVFHRYSIIGWWFLDFEAE